jgi:hypothetical protein
LRFLTDRWTTFPDGALATREDVLPNATVTCVNGIAVKLPADKLQPGQTYTLLSEGPLRTRVQWGKREIAIEAERKDNIDQDKFGDGARSSRILGEKDPRFDADKGMQGDPGEALSGRDGNPPATPESAMGNFCYNRPRSDAPPE